MAKMIESCLRLHFLLVLLLCSISVSSIFVMKDPDFGQVACRPHQIQAFTQFKNEFDTRACNHSESLNGVWCDNSTGAVTWIRLRSCLSGILKPNSSLFQFHQIRYLDLGENNFIPSSLPSEFGKLNRLEVLNLSSNGFLGPIPSSFNTLNMLSFLDFSYNKLTEGFQFLRNLRKLSYLQLSNNHFSGILDSNNSLFELNQLRFLDLGYNNFTPSSLPYELGKLNKLELLSLSSNGFFGQVPPTISNLTLLTELYLDMNELSGSLPLVQNLTRLSFLQLSNNHFSGTIPSSLFTMPSLSYLELWRNDLNGYFEVPNSASSSRLKRLYLGNNHFEGNIIQSITKLINLKELDLSFLNTSYPIDLSVFSPLKSLLLLDLSGVKISQASLSSDSGIPTTLEALRLKQCNITEFPNILKSLQNLVHISLSRNIIGGKIPEWIWRLPRLNSLFIDNNLLSGFEGSSEILVNSSVQILVMHINSFEGELPHLPHSINFLSANRNRFVGGLPLSFCNRSSLTVLDLSYNNFTGPLPPCLSKFFFLNLRKNKFEGSIPDMFSVDAPLRIFDAGYNLLTGELPRSLLNCSSLQYLSVDYNGIKDRFPFSLKALPNLQVLILSANQFYGPLSSPTQGPLGFPELRILEIAGNKFTGSLPPNFFENWKAASVTMNENVGLYMVYKKVIYGTYYTTYSMSIDLRYKGLSTTEIRSLTSYATIDFSGNRLEGQFPESIGLLKALIALNVSNNAFTGHIPQSFSNMRKLESLDLSRNQFSGAIPSGIGSLSFLAYINVSHNQLSGEIPQGPQIMGQPKSSFEANAGLCGFPLEENCFRTKTQPPAKQAKEEDEEEEEQVLSWKAMSSPAINLFFTLLCFSISSSHALSQSKKPTVQSLNVAAAEIQMVNPKLPPRSLSLTSSKKFEGSSDLIHLRYHMGPVLSSSPINIYVIWYGRWSRPHKSLIRDFLNSISDAKAPSPSVAEWWRTASLYTDQTGANVSRSVLIAGEYSDAKYSHGQHLTRLSIQEVIASAARSASFPVDHKNGMYLVLTSHDVTMQDFCRAVCGFHYFTFPSMVGYTMPYAWVGQSGKQCPEVCAYPFALPGYMGHGGPGELRPPNGETGVDGMVSVIGHELAEVVSNPLINAWYAGEDPTAPTEIGDLCEGLYGTGGGGGYIGQVMQDREGKTFNMNGKGGRKFLVQWIWNPNLKACSGPNSVD